MLFWCREGKSKDEVPVVPEEITEKVEIVDDDTDSDTVIANMLQMQYDQEYDLMLKRTEAKFNRDSKGILFLKIEWKVNIQLLT